MIDTDFKCALCGLIGPFATPKEVEKATKGKYSWDNVCKWCRKEIPISERPKNNELYLKGPVPL